MMQTQRMSPGADVCEKSIRTKSEDVDNDLDFGFISIHAPRVGSDSTDGTQPSGQKLFQSTLPVWGATYVADARMRSGIFQSTLPVWGATAAANVALSYNGFQSTLPVWGATPDMAKSILQNGKFQSTLPVWGATHNGGGPTHGEQHFNPRSPCGERLSTPPRSVLSRIFQSTLPVWGATPELWAEYNRILFQSTLPVWGATKLLSMGQSNAVNFNPRSPCGERQGHIPRRLRLIQISIHAPRVGSDLCVYAISPVFNSISIHAPRVGSDFPAAVGRAGG